MPPRKIQTEQDAWHSLVGPAAARVSTGVIRLSFLTGELIIVLALFLGLCLFFSGKYREQHGSEPNRAALKGHQGLVEAVVFSPDGRTLASCGWDTSVRLWNLGDMSEGREAVADSLPHDSVQYAVAFSPDGTLLASGGQGSITVWSRASGRWRTFLDLVGRSYRCVAFSPDGRTLALGCDDGSIKVWEVPSGEERGVLRAHVDMVRSLAFAPDGQRLVSSGQDRLIMLWDTKRCAPIRSLSRPGGNPVQPVAFSPDGRTVAVGEVCGSPLPVTLVDPETGDIRTELAGHLSGINALAFSPDGATLATAGLDRCIKLWNLKAGKELTTLTKDVGWVKALAFSPDSRWLAFAGNDNYVRIWDLARQRSRRVGPIAAPRSREVETAS